MARHRIKSVAARDPNAYLGSMAGMISIRPGFFAAPKGDGQSRALVANGLGLVAALRAEGNIKAAAYFLSQVRAERVFLMPRGLA